MKTLLCNHLLPCRSSASWLPRPQSPFWMTVLLPPRRRKSYNQFKAVGAEGWVSPLRKCGAHNHHGPCTVPLLLLFFLLLSSAFPSPILLSFHPQPVILPCFMCIILQRAYCSSVCMCFKFTSIALHISFSFIFYWALRFPAPSSWPCTYLIHCCWPLTSACTLMYVHYDVHSHLPAPCNLK